jgi:hypothetical protein
MAFLTLLALLAQDGRTLELFDVRDLAERPRDFPLTEARPAKDAKTAGVDVLCRSLLSPRSTVELDGELLTVNATSDEHARVRQLLELLRGKTRHLVSVEVRFLRTAGLHRKTEVLSEAEAQALLKDVETQKAPRMTAFSGQLAHVSEVNHTAYLRDYALTLGKDGTEVEPVVDVARSGVSLAVRPVIADAEKERILLEDLEIVLEQPRQPAFRAIKTPFGAIEDPEIRTHRFAVPPRLLNKGEVLLAGPLPPPWPGKDALPTWALIACRVSEDAPKKR